MTFHVLGKGLPRLDAAVKATGEAPYTGDLQFPGMLHGKILRSPLPHGRIKSIHTEAARHIPGVRCVITAADLTLNLFSFMQHLADKTMLCSDKVRYLGDEVAAVAADHAEAAERALQAIRVEYEELPPILDVDEALRPDAVQIHEGKSNIAFQTHRVTGDPDRAFGECDHVCEGTYNTGRVAHCCLEVSNCVAQWGPAGPLRIWSNTQAPHTQRQEIARILGIPVHQVQVMTPFIGGAFGSRLVTDMKAPIAAVLSQRTGRPVHIENTRSEEFSTGKTRYPYRIHIKTGAKTDGRLLAQKVQVTADNGAYNDKGPGTLAVAGTSVGVLYDVPNTMFEARLVYTNHQNGTAFRGFGNPQITFALESQLDELAHQIGLSPLELRLRNANVPGRTTHYGAEIKSCGLRECMEAAARCSKRPSEKDSRRLRGTGMANVVHTGGGSRVYGYNAADTLIKIDEVGRVSIITPAVDMGQGAHTAIAQIVAEELGVRLKDTKIIGQDTDVTPYDLGAWASRTTYICGNAARAAAREARQELISCAAQWLRAPPDRLVIANSTVNTVDSPRESARPLAELMEFCVKDLGHTISGRGRHVDRIPEGCSKEDFYRKTIPTFAFGTQVAEVEVDPDTGAVRVLKIIAAHDLGRVVNRAMAEGQVEGSIVQGLGYALMESAVYADGRFLNDTFLDYKIPRSADIPDIETILIETDDPDGPFGAKGIGEPAIVPTAAAIANAVFDACGVRVRRLPISPEDIVKNLRHAPHKGTQVEQTRKGGLDAKGPQELP